MSGIKIDDKGRIHAYDELYYRQYTSKSEIDKALQTLKGILLSIGFDKVINNKEIAELKRWCEVHMDLANRNPFREFMTHILNCETDYLLRPDIIEDLYWLCQKYENDTIYYKEITPDIQQLHGICHGILADGIINDQEVIQLEQWIESNQHLASYYPYDEIRCIVQNILRDKLIEDAEKTMLMAYISEFVNIQQIEIKNQIEEKTKNVTIYAMCTPDPIVNFSNKSFCFTGIFKSCQRNELIQMVKQLGGYYNNNVTKETHYLIVGDNGNPCFAYACYGRKVEKAANLRKAGSPIVIVHEFDFWDFVEEERGKIN